MHHPRTPRRRRVMIAMMAAVLMLGATAAVVRPTQDGYTPTQIVSGLRQQPRAWVGRTMPVRGYLFHWAWKYGLLATYPAWEDDINAVLHFRQMYPMSHYLYNGMPAIAFNMAGINPSIIVAVSLSQEDAYTPTPDRWQGVRSAVLQYPLLHGLALSLLPPPRLYTVRLVAQTACPAPSVVAVGTHYIQGFCPRAVLVQAN